MKRTSIRALLLLFVPISLVQAGTPYTVVERKSADGKYAYKTVEGDDLGTRVYTLKNGLTVMLSVNKSEPRLQTLIAVKTGSKMDPSDNTGLAHYLEHMLFKGTDRYGTRDWSKEKPQLDAIEALYEQYNHTTDPTARKRIYHEIDSVSQIAAQYAIANEYDKLLSAIGAKGTNAFTSFEQTVYVNDIPSNQMEKWLTVEAERFRNPVLRLFHTELEAVYEEKNISLDNDDDKVNEAMMAELFHNHAYGTQTTIGTVEHLKNPSLKKIEAFYRTYYVPNNMAIILAGDLDPDRTIEMIDRTFGSMQPKPVPTYTFKPEAPHSAPIVRTVMGPDPESVTIGFRLPGVGSREADLLMLTDGLLSYKSAGLIDLNLNQAQKVLEAYSYYDIMKDYSYAVLNGKPLDGQSLDDVRKLMLDQVELIKAGKFDEGSLQAIVRNMKKDLITRYQSNPGRAYSMLNTFVLGRNWEDEVATLDRLAKISKQEVVDFVRKYYGNDQVVVYKKIGEDDNIVKVDKPEITPVDVNRDAESEFLKTVINTPAPPVKPVFVDYQKDITRTTMSNGIPMLYLHNDENKLFSLYYVFDMGKRNDKKLALAINYLKYLGTDKYSADRVRTEFFKLACQFNVSSGADQVYVSLSGLQESFEPGLKLFEEFLAHVKPDQEALDRMVAAELKNRADAKLDKSRILWGGLYNYAMYGKDNPFTDQLSESQLKSLKAKELVDYLKSLTGYRHKVYYYGPASTSEVTAMLDRYHHTPATLKDYPAEKQYVRQAINDNVVYFVDQDMVQAEILWLSKSTKFSPDMIPITEMFNEYYGGGMSSVVFQTIRESKALAYSTFSAYNTPDKKEDPNYVFAYVGTQADKINQAIPAMNDLLTTLPRTEQAFVTSKAALRNKIETERITRTGILFDYQAAQKLGLDHDQRMDVYNNLDKMTLDDLQRFHEQYLEHKPYAYCVMGSKEKINLDDLKKYGRVVVLTKEDLFGY